MSEPQQRERRKRKWDVPDEKAIAAVSVSSGLTAVIPDSANAAAARINAMLAAKGIIAKEPNSHSIPINDCRPDIRYHLTKGATHDQLLKETGATVIARGRYKPPGDPSPDPALYLFITAENQKNVEDATAKIQQIIAGAAQSNFIAKSYIGIDPLADPNFPLIGKVLGPKGSFVKHITTETGAKVQLRGKGSGFLEAPTQQESPEPLHLHIGGNTPQSVDSAKALADNLLQHVRQDYTTFCAAKSKPPAIPAGFGPIPPHLAGFAQNPAYQNPAYQQNPYYQQQQQQQAGLYQQSMNMHQQQQPLYQGYPPTVPGYGYPAQPGYSPQQGYPQHPQAQPGYPGQQHQPVPPNYPQVPGYGQPGYPPQQGYPQHPQAQAYPAQPYQAQQIEEPQADNEAPQKRRFQEYPDKKDEGPAVGPQRPSEEEMAAYSLPDATELMPPPPPVAVKKKPADLLGTPTTQANRAKTFTEQPRQKVGKTKVKGGTKLVDYDPEAGQEEEDMDIAGADDYRAYDVSKKANSATTTAAAVDTKPKPTTPQRPFWAAPGNSSTPVIKPLEDDEPKRNNKRSSDDKKYEDVFNELGIKRR